MVSKRKNEQLVQPVESIVRDCHYYEEKAQQQIHERFVENITDYFWCGGPHRFTAL